VLFAQGNIPIPNTFFTNNKDLLKSVEQIEAICEYPLIVKDIRGLKGNFSVFINNRTELLEQSALLPKHRKFMYQQFIPNDFDWGVLVANNEVVSAEKSYRQAGSEFRNNTFIGATEVFVDVDLIPDNIKQIALQASSQLGLSWSRSDIIVDKFTDMPYIMETNRSPGLTSGTTEVTGARSYLQEFITDVKNKRNAEQRQLQFEQIIITSESRALVD
jgi:glutathione synthase/RimK-type ligase-like ATP-grasp enzyme